MNPGDEDKIKKLNELFDDFHTNMLELMKRQTELLEKVNKLLDEKKLKEARERIEKI